MQLQYQMETSQIIARHTAATLIIAPQREAEACQMLTISLKPAGRTSSLKPRVPLQDLERIHMSWLLRLGQNYHD